MKFCSIVSTFFLQNTRLKGSFDQIRTLKKPFSFPVLFIILIIYFLIHSCLFLLFHAKIGIFLTLFLNFVEK